MSHPMAKLFERIEVMAGISARNGEYLKAVAVLSFQLLGVSDTVPGDRPRGSTR